MTLERLEITPFPTLVGEILLNRRSGHLTVVKAPIRKILYWAQGELVMAGSAVAEDSLSSFLVSRGAIAPDQAAAVAAADPTEVVAHVHEAGLLDLSTRQTALREWLHGQFVPLFNLDEGTAVFTDDEPLAPENRIFVQSTAAMVVEGVRSINNGLVLRRALGDLERLIQPARDVRLNIDALPLTEQERSIATALDGPAPLGAFLRRFGAQSSLAGKVAIALLAIGAFETAETRDPRPAETTADTQRDMEILASLSSGDERSLQVINLSRRLDSLDHYGILHIPHAATRPQIKAAAEQLKNQYDPALYPPAVRIAAGEICHRIDEAADVLSDPSKRSAYDRLLGSVSREGSISIQQRLTQSTIARQNFARAKELSVAGDYYGAIVLLKQAVRFSPDSVEAWHLLGACQERNPRWRRDAAESYQKALSVDPNDTEVLISLGDLYRLEGMTTRAQTCYSDVLKIDPQNPQARSRLDALNKH